MQLKKDQEDLLILLADQETKIETYKSKLKEVGFPVSSFLFTLFRYQFFLQYNQYKQTKFQNNY